MRHSANYQIMLTDAEGTAVVHVSGEIDLNAKVDLTRALARASAGGRNLIVDMSRTTFIDSTALKALLDAWRSQTGARLGFVLRNPATAVRRTLEIAGLEDMLPTSMIGE
jgi:anti-anti-sigma factor